MLLNRNSRIILIVGSVAICVLCSCGINTVEAKKKTYMEKGMEFVVGQHAPEKRINPKHVKGVAITQVIVVDSEQDDFLPQNEKGISDTEKEEEIEHEQGKGIESEEENITDASVTENKTTFSSVFKETLDSIKNLWEKFTNFEKKTETRLKILENKFTDEEAVKDEIDKEGIEKGEDSVADQSNVEELIELTSQITEEMAEQENRIVELEAANNKQRVDGDEQ